MGNTVTVKANTNVLGLHVGEAAELPLDTPDLPRLLQIGKLVQLDQNGNEIASTIRPARRCCGHRG